jgi:hypothetical protein
VVIHIGYGVWNLNDLPRTLRCPICTFAALSPPTSLGVLAANWKVTNESNTEHWTAPLHQFQSFPDFETWDRIQITPIPQLEGFQL